MDLRATGPAQVTSVRLRRSRDSICHDWLTAVQARVPAAKDKQAILIIDSLARALHPAREGAAFYFELPTKERSRRSGGTEKAGTGEGLH